MRNYIKTGRPPGRPKLPAGKRVVTACINLRGEQKRMLSQVAAREKKSASALAREIIDTWAAVYCPCSRCLDAVPDRLAH